MIVLHSAGEFAGQASVVALGMFDGVHIGHQKLIRDAVKLADEMGAQCIVCTFDRHPLSLLAPERAPKPLLSMQENLRKFEQLGVDAAFIQTFTKEFAGMNPEDYLKDLVENLRAKAIVIGENYTFGRGGCGNVRMVRQLAEEFGYLAKVVEPVADQEGMISSTRIRRMLKDGEAERASALLDICTQED